MVSNCHQLLVSRVWFAYPSNQTIGDNCSTLAYRERLRGGPRSAQIPRPRRICTKTTLLAQVPRPCHCLGYRNLRRRCKPATGAPNANKRAEVGSGIRGALLAWAKYSTRSPVGLPLFPVKFWVTNTRLFNPDRKEEPTGSANCFQYL
jgi:hypothetical protein